MGSFCRSLGVAAAVCLAAGCGTTSYGGGANTGGPDAGSGGAVDAGGGSGGLPDAGMPDAGIPDAGTPDAGAPDAGYSGGGPDAGASGGGSPDAGTGGGGSTDGGTAVNDCEGLAPGALPAMVQYRTTVDYSLPHGVCQMALGDGRGFVAHEVSNQGHPTWTILTPEGKTNGSFGFWHGEAFPNPQGFIGYGGSSTEQAVVVDAFDETGAIIGSHQVHGSAIFNRDPRGGLLAVGRLSNSPEGTGAPPAEPVAMMFDADGTVRWSPTPLPSGNAAVFGSGVDLLGRSLVIVDGGNGAIDAVWFEANGNPGGVFHLLTGFQAGVNTWFETSPLIGGGLAIRRMDAPTASAFPEQRTSAWLAVVPSLSSSAQPPPDWLKQRPNTQMQLAQGGRAYAFLPWAADVSACDQQAEVVSPSGNSCGKLDFPVDGASCTTRDLRLGLDGTVLQMLPIAREQNDPPGSAVYTCTLRFWPAALH